MKKKESASLVEIQQSESASLMPQSSNSMVDIVVRMKQDEMFANLKVSSFDLILSLEFLLKIAQFVTVPQDSKAAPAPAPLASTTVARRKNKTPKIEDYLLTLHYTFVHFQRLKLLQQLKPIQIRK